MSKQFAFALCVTTILGGTESVYAETPKLLEEGRDGKHILVKKKKGKPFSFKRKRQTAAIETGKVTPQGRKRSKKTFSFKRKSLNRAPHVAALETGKVNLLGRKRTRKPFSFFFKRKHQAAAAEAGKINLQVRKKSKKLFSFKRNRQALAAETGKVNFQMRKKPRKFFSFTRKSLNKRSQIAPIPLVSSIRPVRNGHLVLKSLTSKAPLNQYREERKVIRAHPSVQNIIFFPRTERDTLAVKQILRNKPTISQVETPAATVKAFNNVTVNRDGQTVSNPVTTHVAASPAEVRASNNTEERDIVLQPTVSELVTAHVVTPTTGGSSSHEVAENEDGGQAVVSEAVSALAAIHAEESRSSLDPVENGDGQAFEPVAAHVAAHGEGENISNEAVEDEIVLQPVVSEAVSALAAIHAEESRSSLDPVENGDGQAFEPVAAHVAAHGEGENISNEAVEDEIVLQPAVSEAVSALPAIHEEELRSSLDVAEDGEGQVLEPVAAHVAAPEEETRAGNGSDENETVLSELSDLLSTHVIDPVKEAFGLDVPNDAVENRDGQAFEQVDAHAAALDSELNETVLTAISDPAPTHTEVGGEDVSAANDLEESETVLPELFDLLSTHVIDPVKEVFGLDSSNDVAADGDSQAFEQVDAHAAALDSELKETVLTAISDPAPTDTDAAVEEISAANDLEERETVLPELSDLLSTHVIDPVKEVFGLDVPNDAVENRDGQAFEQVDAHAAALDSELNETVLTAISDPAPTDTDAAVEEISAANDLEERETVLPELSDLLSTHVIDPVKEVFGLDSSNDVAADGDSQAFEQVDAHAAALDSELNETVLTAISDPAPTDTDAAVEEISAANDLEENEIVLQQAISDPAIHAEGNGAVIDSIVEQDLTPANNGGGEAGAEVESVTTLENEDSPDQEVFGDGTATGDDQELKEVDTSTTTFAVKDDASDGEEELGLSSIFTDHAEDLEDKNLQTTTDGLNLSSEKPTDTSLDDDLLSLYDYDDRGIDASSMNNGDMLYQLSSLLSGKEPTPSASNSFLEESEDFTPNSDLLAIQEEIGKITLNNQTLYHQMSADEFETESKKLQDSQRKAVDLAISLSEVEDQANGDESLLSQITQVRELLQNKAQQLLDLQARVDHVSKKREEEKLSSDQTKEAPATSVDFSPENGDGALSTSLDRSNGFSVTTDYSMRDMSPQESFYQLSSLLSGKTSEPSYGSLILQQEESNPILFDIQEKIRDIHPNVGVLFHQMSPSEFEAERLQLESLQGKAANLVVMLNEIEEQESGNGGLLEQISYVKKTLQDKAQQLLDLQIRVDHVSKQREDGEKRRLEEQNLSFGQIEGSMGETGTDEMTRQHTQIPSDALPLLETAIDESTSSSIPTPSVSSEESNKFVEFSTHLTALTSLLGGSSDKLRTLEDSQKASTKGILTPRLVKLLQNNLHDQAQTLGLQTSFEKFEEERELSYDEALSALPQLLQFASSIQADTLINLNTPTTYVRLLNNFLSNFVKSLSGDQAQ